MCFFANFRRNSFAGGGGEIVEARRVNWSRGHSTNARSLSDVAALREGERDTEPNMGWKLLREGRGSEANT